MILTITTSIIAILLFWGRDYKVIKELLLRYVNKISWIDCDEKFLIDGRHFTYRGEGEGTCTISLQSGQFVVGTVDSGFQASVFSGMVSDRCAAFLLKGPLQITFSMDVAGGGDFYFATPYKDVYYEDKWTELVNHISCNNSVRGYDKIECNQSDCWIWP